MPVGLLLSGVVIGSDYTTDKDGKKQLVIAIAMGITSERVYMRVQPETVPPFGTDVIVKCRAYAGRTGRIVYVDGEIVD